MINIFVTNVSSSISSIFSIFATWFTYYFSNPLMSYSFFVFVATGIFLVFNRIQKIFKGGTSL